MGGLFTSGLMSWEGQSGWALAEGWMWSLVGWLKFEADKEQSQRHGFVAKLSLENETLNRKVIK